MQPSDRRRLGEALVFALDAHAGQTRKGKPVPYASHLLQVAGLVLEHGGDVEQAMAALLHDTLEDCEGVDEQALRARFGPRVTAMVVACSDLLEGDSPARKSPWTERKTRYLEHLRSADRDTQLVAACDKLHNLANIVTDLRTEGADFLERFNASPPQTLWYFEQVRASLGPDLPAALLLDFDTQLEALRPYTGPASPAA